MSSDRVRRLEGGNVVRGVPLPSDYRGSGERRKFSQRGPKMDFMDFMHILGQKEAIWNTIFSIFERRRGPPKRLGARENFSPSPLSTGLMNRCRE